MIRSLKVIIGALVILCNREIDAIQRELFTSPLPSPDKRRELHGQKAELEAYRDEMKAMMEPYIRS
jgi:hypothetical protein